MDFLAFFSYVNKLFALPSTLIFFAVALYLTAKTRFLQVRAFPRFLTLITGGLKKSKSTHQGNTISSFHALFTAMATTLGMGNIIGPSIAIITGGPGAIFWLILYAFLASATKFTEVVCAINTREIMADGTVVGGPTQYLRLVNSWIANWYGFAMIFLMAGWSGLQANTLASIFAQEQIPHWMTGISLAIIVLLVLYGGAQRVGNVASKLVPIMSITYILFALLILFKNTHTLMYAFSLIFDNIFSPAAPIGGFFGATIIQAMRAGVYKSIFITEAGIGTSSIPHAIADVQKATDQGILAMYSMAADAFLSLLSGLLVLVTDLWITSGFSNTLMYEVFKLNSPLMGRLILIMSISLFVLTTVIGNSFSGGQTFASFTQNRWRNYYYFFAALVIFAGSLMNVPLIWEIMDLVLTFVAIPNLIGLIVLSVRKPEWMRA